MKITHKHHIIPRHMGGTGDSSNLVELTVAEHAEAHRQLFEKHGYWQDEVAWRCLSGQIGHEEAIRQASLLARKGKQLPPRSLEHCAKISASKKGKPRSLETRAKIGAAQKGKPKPPRSLQHRARMSVVQKGKPKSVAHCAKLSVAAKNKSYTRNNFGEFAKVIT